MYEHAFSAFERLVYEAERLVGNRVARIQDDLVIGIQPGVTEVDDTDGLPMVGHLPTTTVHDTRDLVGYNKF